MSERFPENRGMCWNGCTVQIFYMIVVFEIMLRLGKVLLFSMAPLYGLC